MLVLAEEAAAPSADEIPVPRGAVLLEEPEGLAVTPRAVLTEVGEVLFGEALVSIGLEDVTTAPDAALVGSAGAPEYKTPGEVADAEALAALDVYDAKMAELADPASRTGQTVCKRLLAILHNRSSVMLIPCPP